MKQPFDHLLVYSTKEGTAHPKDMAAQQVWWYLKAFYEAMNEHTNEQTDLVIYKSNFRTGFPISCENGFASTKPLFVETAIDDKNSVFPWRDEVKSIHLDHITTHERVLVAHQRRTPENIYVFLRETPEALYQKIIADSFLPQLHKTEFTSEEK